MLLAYAESGRGVEKMSVQKKTKNNTNEGKGRRVRDGAAERGEKRREKPTTYFLRRK